MNQVLLVGRVAENTILEEKEHKKITIVKISVPRNFKNANGEYDIDYLDCILWNGIAANTTEYVKAGDIIGIRGRLAQLVNEDKPIIIVEKITFLSSGNGGKENE